MSVKRELHALVDSSGQAGTEEVYRSLTRQVLLTRPNLDDKARERVLYDMEMRRDLT